MINQELIDDAKAAGFVISWGKISLLTDNDAIPIQDELAKFAELIKARVLADSEYRIKLDIANRLVIAVSQVTESKKLTEQSLDNLQGLVNAFNY